MKPRYQPRKIREITVCLPEGYQGQGTWSVEDFIYDPNLQGSCVEFDALQACFDMLEGSTLASFFIHEIAAEGWSISISDLDGPDFFIETSIKQLTLNTGSVSLSALSRSDYFRNDMTCTLIRGMRDIWQEKRSGDFSKALNPEDFLMFERVRSADLDILTVIIAWELKNNGCNRLWRHLIGSQLGDIALAFLAIVNDSPHDKTAFLRAANCAFYQWFEDERRMDSADHDALEYLDELREEALYHPAGKRLQKIDLERLSCLPDKTAYLAGSGEDILRDPAFSGLCDPLNQAHFAQIVHDLDATIIQGVAFRDTSLAYKIFPQDDIADEETVFQDVF